MLARIKRNIGRNYLELGWNHDLLQLGRNNQIKKDSDCGGEGEKRIIDYLNPH
jgi:hypothetical protein